MHTDEPAYVTLLGVFAGVLTTIAFLPQVLKIWRTKSTGDISLAMLVTFIMGISVWLVYGVLIRSLPIILANSVTLVLTVVILCFKLRYK